MRKGSYDLGRDAGNSLDQFRRGLSRLLKKDFLIEILPSDGGDKEGRQGGLLTFLLMENSVDHYTREQNPSPQSSFLDSWQETGLDGNLLRTYSPCLLSSLASRSASSFLPFAFNAPSSPFARTTRTSSKPRLVIRTVPSANLNSASAR